MAPARAVWPLGPRRRARGRQRVPHIVQCLLLTIILPAAMANQGEGVPQNKASSCPNGWHAWSSKCFLSPPLLSRHDGCATICEAQARALDSTPRPAGLACLASQEENDFVAAHVLGANKHWIGLHRAPSQRRLADDPWRGEWAAHDLCGNGSFDNWRSPGGPSVQIGRDCVIVDGSGQWHAVGCARAEYRCLCELDAPTRPDYPETIAAIVARTEAYSWQLLYGALPLAVALVATPAVMLLMTMWMHPLLKPVDAFQRDLLTKPQQQTLRHLSLAERCSSQQRLRTSHVFFQLGWALIVVGLFPMSFHYVIADWPATDLGTWTWYVPLVSIGGHVLGMVIQPSDRTLIRMTAYMLAGLWGFLGLLDGVTAHKYASDAAYPIFYAALWALWCVLNICSAVAVCQGISKHSRAAPRLLLKNLWAVGRFMVASTGLSTLVVCVIPLAVRDPVILQDPYAPGATLTIACFTIIPLVMTPSRRSRLRAAFASSSWLVSSSTSTSNTGIMYDSGTRDGSSDFDGGDGGGGCSGGGHGAAAAEWVGSAFERQHYALAAALVQTGHSTDLDVALENAKDYFSCCTLRIAPGDRVERVNRSSCARLLRELRMTHERAEFGTVDAFVSHSSADDDRLKWLALRRWAADFRAAHGRWPRIWFDRACSLDTIRCGGEVAEVVVGSLPLVVAGCTRLLVLAGEGYASRLWTLVEIIVFLWSQGGKEDAIEVLPLLQYRDAAKEAELLASLHRADVDAARCQLNEDRQLMLAAIESTFGTAQALNAKLRALLTHHCTERLPSVPKPPPVGAINVLTLGSDVLQRCILRRLPPQDVLNAALVCHEWHRSCGEASLWTLPIVEVVFSTVEVDDIKLAELRLFQHMGAAAEHRQWISEGRARCYWDLVAPSLRDLGRSDVDEREIGFVNMLLKVMPRYMDLVYGLVHNPAVSRERASVRRRSAHPPATAIEQIDDTLLRLQVDCRQLYCRCMRICFAKADDARNEAAKDHAVAACGNSHPRTVVGYCMVFAGAFVSCWCACLLWGCVAALRMGKRSTSPPLTTWSLLTQPHLAPTMQLPSEWRTKLSDLMAIAGSFCFWLLRWAPSIMTFVLMLILLTSLL